MTERSITVEILKHLRANLPGAHVVKHNDIGTKGVADIRVVTRADQTSWAEIKFLRPKDTLKKINKAQQLVFCHEEAVVSNGRCWVVVYELQPKRVTVWQPRALFAHLWPNVAGAKANNGRLAGCRAPIDLDSPDTTGAESLADILRTFGAFRTPWSYDIVTRLIKDATHA